MLLFVQQVAHTFVVLWQQRDLRAGIVLSDPVPDREREDLGENLQLSIDSRGPPDRTIFQFGFSPFLLVLLEQKR